MTEQVALDSQTRHLALALLEREQAVYLLTDRERRLYRWFSVCVYSMAVAFGLVLAVGAAASETTDLNLVIGLFALVGVVLMLATIVLLFLNWSLMGKLYAHARLRKRLRLADYFAGLFSAAGKRKFVGNVFAFLTFAAGWLIILFAFAGAAIVVFEEQLLNEIGLLTASAVYLGMFLVGVSFISFRYLRRGKQRLDVVLRLQKTLTEQAAHEAAAQDVTLSPEDYNTIASIERRHIIRERASSIAGAHKGADMESYSCQSSRQMYTAKSKLPPELLVKVESAIARLIDDPLPTGAAGDPTGLKIAPVLDTGLCIQYDVDPGRRIVRLHDLQTEQGTSLSEAGADGLH